MITLSIITINYNDAAGLRKTLDSVAAQTYPHIQHIIVDGGSTDGSVEIIREYADNQCKVESVKCKGTENSKAEPLASTPSGVPDKVRDFVGCSYTLHLTPSKHRVLWVSEPDKGIYNAMNKGIEIALGHRVVNSFNRSELVEDKNKGIEIALGRREVREDHTSLPIANGQWPIAQTDYIQILNAGDILAAPDVTERMVDALAHQCKVESVKCKGGENGAAEMNMPYRLENCPAIFYGNMTKVNAAGQIVGKSGYTEYSLRQFYQSTLNHDCAYIRKDLFEEYGLYDENLKIVSDWKWYLQAIGLGRVKPEYVDIDVTIFDDGGISETNLELRNRERRQVLEELLPLAVLWDYDTHAFEVEQVNRLRRWHLYPLVYFMERVLFKLEKWGVLKR